LTISDTLFINYWYKYDVSTRHFPVLIKYKLYLIRIGKCLVETSYLYQ